MWQNTQLGLKMRGYIPRVEMYKSVSPQFNEPLYTVPSLSYGEARRDP